MVSRKDNFDNQSYDNPRGQVRDQPGGYRGDVPPRILDRTGSIHSEAGISTMPEQRERGPQDYGYERRYRRPNDDYEYNQRPRKDPLGWNSLIDEGCKAWEAVLAEFLGVLVLVFVGCGSCVNWRKAGEPNTIQIALAFGTTRATIATVIGHISGTHVNPAVTVGLCIGKKIKPAKALFYIVFQVLGAIVGAALLNAIVPESFNDSLGQTHPNPHITQWQAVLVESVVTFMLTLTVFAVCDELRSDIKGSAPLMIGFVIMTCHLMAVPITGSSMNPARSSGPAIIKNNFQHLWIYWLGPCTGSTVAGIMYVFLLHKEEIEAANESIHKTRATGPHPDPTNQWSDPGVVSPLGAGTTSNQSVGP